jgi:OmpA-OmpF porin, OOP family
MAVRVAQALACLLAVAVPPAGGLAQAVENEASDESAWALAHRRFNTRDGSSGGIMIADPGSGAVGSLRLQLVLDTFPGDDFLSPGDEIAQSARALSLSWTALGPLEVFAALRDRGTSQDAPEPSALHAQGLLFGFKLFQRVHGPLTAGGGLRFDVRNGLGRQTPALGATSIGLNAAAGFDFQELAKELPLVGRLNIDYLFDNSAAAIEDAEDARYRSLRNALPREDDTRHLISRSERYAFGINRVDTLSVGVGGEAKLAVAERTSLHPLLEWRMGVPINRQAYDCPVSTGSAGSRGDAADACLGTTGVDAWSMNLVAGLRVVPPVRGVSLALALDLGLSGTSTFVRELAPNSPFMLTFALGYDYDARPAPARVAAQTAAEPRAEPEPPVAPRAAAVEPAVAETQATPAAEEPAPAEPAALEPELAAPAGADTADVVTEAEQSAER